MARKILEMGGEMKREGGEVWERKEMSFLLTREKRREILREREELGEETPLATEIISVAREGGVRWIEKEERRKERGSRRNSRRERERDRERERERGNEKWRKSGRRKKGRKREERREKRKRKKEERERKRNPEEREEERMGEKRRGRGE